jgi:hypothetical protein
MTRQEAAQQMKTALRAAGVKARVRQFLCCGAHWVQVFGVNAAAQFSDEEQATVKGIAQSLGLTGVRGSEIRMDQATNPFEFNFEAGR